ncbi:tyrosine-type recombinase/integrase [Candidatus Phycosocius spiralis]|uniref:tyrosine-type recombinase/integrase n=1 Tax=Candidatus Phycosocius spiralis TaxID=2815099 RepID=UPI0024E08CF8|nr:tyrosine-type recombinase/integrase [Candidatus Phycosocius spiralis]
MASSLFAPSYLGRAFKKCVKEIRNTVRAATCSRVKPLFNAKRTASYRTSSPYTCVMVLLLIRCFTSHPTGTKPLQVQNSINTLTELSPDDRLFPFNNGLAWYRWDALRERMKEIGTPIDDVVLHSLRHTCLTRLAKRLPIQIVSKWAGHADFSITARVYSHLSVDDLLGGLDVLNNSSADIQSSTNTALSVTG